MKKTDYQKTFNASFDTVEAQKIIDNIDKKTETYDEMIRFILENYNKNDACILIWGVATYVTKKSAMDHLNSVENTLIEMLDIMDIKYNKNLDENVH